MLRRQFGMKRAWRGVCVSKHVCCHPILCRKYLPKVLQLPLPAAMRLYFYGSSALKGMRHSQTDSIMLGLLRPASILLAHQETS